ncbi:MAG: hypothetical protein K0S65_5676 [Labilithrix sp.]|nr:hypothetical protein [Labilithrix sp.]
MTIRSVASTVVLVGLMAWPCIATAHVPQRDAMLQSSRLFTGFELGLMTPSKLWIDGKDANEGNGNLNVGFHAGYSHSLGRYLGVLGLTGSAPGRARGPKHEEKSAIASTSRWDQRYALETGGTSPRRWA